MRRRYYSKCNSAEDYIIRYAKRRIRGTIITVISIIVTLLFVFVFARPIITAAAAVLHNSKAGSGGGYPDNEPSSYEYETEETFGDSDCFSKNLVLTKKLAQISSIYANAERGGSTVDADTESISRSVSTGDFEDTLSDTGAAPKNQYRDMGDEIGTIRVSKKWQTFHVCADGDYSNQSHFSIETPGIGYIIFKVINSGDKEPHNYVQVSADGFESAEFLTPKKPKTYIGVGRGRYTVSTFTLGSGFDICIKFVQVKEGKFAARPKKAPVLTRYISRKGIIRTDKPAAHWYRIRHKNTKPIKIKVKTRNSAGGIGGIRVSLYEGSRCLSSASSFLRCENLEIKCPSYKGARHLDKGIYYIKVEGHSGGNGYFSVRWK